MDDLRKRLGANIRKARNRRGLTQAEVAERIDMPVEVYGRMERGSMLPRLERLLVICDALGETPDGLLGFPRPRLRSTRGDA
ncbi:MAG: helix-turn-helix transcriptional regulator [Myxococcaceae bacterium]|nr:helix-turn-helix transcriptional regulator [Myxococcaceae bacterium]